MNNSTNDIAIIGMACRFPGAGDIAQFWDNLRNGVESIRAFSDQELEASGIDPALFSRPNYVKAGAILEDADLFDAAFFNIVPSEAELIDPQHRVFLECAWEVLESAGYDPERYDGWIAVYAGAGYNSYLTNQLIPNPGVVASAGYLQALMSNEKDYLTSRVSYKLNLRGPSLNVQTACSTSLVAVHLSCHALLTYQCDMALAGAVSLHWPQKSGYLYVEDGIQSPDGHTRSFDARARGTSFSSGVGIVALKRLDEAIADGDSIHAVIKGSAINNDGSLKVGYTAPSADGFSKVVAMAMRGAGVAPESISYIETHGSGTALGDPIEIAALNKAFRTLPRKPVCAIGSVKSNFGHLNVAAGVAGLIKTVLALNHRQIPPSLNFDQPNPAIDWENSPFYVNTKLTEWKQGKWPRRAGVNSMGIGGTNAHVILEEAPAAEAQSAKTRACRLLLLSARTATALEAATDRLAAHLETHPEQSLDDVAYTMQVGRKRFAYRRMLVCRNADDAARALRSRDPQTLITGVQPEGEPSVVFMFPGQGAQRINMGKALYDDEPAFRQRVDECAAFLKPHLGLDLRELLYSQRADANEQLKQTCLAQPAMFIIEYALANLLMSWGITPAAMIGHSIGEYVAACLSGVFSLEDGLRLVTARGRMMQSAPAGAMLAVSLSPAALQTLPVGKLSLAAINADNQCVMSGEAEAIAELEQALLLEKTQCRRLNTSHAFHSSMMDEILEAFAEEVRKIRLSSPQIPFPSNTSGTWITSEEATDANYWSRHLRDTVRFAEGVKTLIKDKNPLFIEVGPGETLSQMVKQIAGNRVNYGVLAALGRGHDTEQASETFLRTLGGLYMQGIEPDWSKFHAGESRRRIPIPTYPFERQRYWVESAATAAGDFAPAPERSPKAASSHPTIETAIDEPMNEIEKAVAATWQDLLGIQRVGIHDDFFRLGGGSLLGIQIMARLRERFLVEIPLETLFKSPTVSSLALAISQQLAQKGDSKLTPGLKEQASASRHTIEPRQPPGSRAPLSFAQQRLWFLDQLQPGSPTYNVAIPLRLNGQLDVPALQQTLNAIVDRHEILRTHFAVVDQQPVQAVRREQSCGLRVEDFSQRQGAAQEAAIEHLAAAEARRPFDLASGPVFRVCLVKIQPDEHILLFTIHHIVSDAWSMGVLIREVAHFYECFTTGRASTLSDLPIQYADYAIWQRQRLQGEQLQKELSYWKRKLSDLPTGIELPFDNPRSPSPDSRGESQSLLLTSELTAQLRQFSQSRGITLFVTMLSAFQLLLFRYSGQDDLAVGTSISGRLMKEAEGLIGFFINMLVLRTDLSGVDSFRDLSERAHTVALEAYTHSELPFEKLVEELNPDRNLNHQPLFEVMFNFLSDAEEPLRLPGLTISYPKLTGVEARFTLTLYVRERGSNLTLQLVGQHARFSAARIETILRQYGYLLEQIAADPDRSIDDYSLVTPESRGSLPDPSQPLAEPRFDPVHKQFLDWVARNPQQIAVSQGKQTKSYLELAQSAESIARRLLAIGHQPGDGVAVTGPRSFGMIASMIAVLMRGGVFLPLDHALPAKRRNYMLLQAGAKFMLSAGTFPDDPPLGGEPHNLAVAYVDQREGHVIGHRETRSADHFPSSFPLPDDPAYIFFTSGSTGTPKGVLGCHKSLSHFLHWQREAFGITTSDRVAQLSGISFDAMLRDILLPLTSGATLCLPPEDGAVSKEVLSWLDHEKVTCVHTVPSMAGVWLRDVRPGVSLRSLRLLFFSGEPLHESLVQRWREAFPLSGEIVNLYGPTETTMIKCFYRVPMDPPASIQPIGGPLPQTQALVLSANDRLCGIGETGEIVLRTPFRTLGYLHSENERRRSFVPNPFRSDPSDLLYHTGDRGRYRLDGSLEILGRFDQQLKVRGVRIEPVEIEAALIDYPGIAEATVAAFDHPSGDRALVAYIVLSHGVVSQPKPADLRRFLSQTLPDYMIPSAFVCLDALPLTPTGKIDRAAVPPPNYALAQELYACPRSFVEDVLVQIWSEVLRLDRIGIYDNFFELGGHSLLATQVISRIDQTLRVELPLRRLFEHPTVESLAVIVEQLQIEQLDDGVLSELLDRLSGLSDAEVEIVLAKHGYLSETSRPDLPQSDALNMS